MRKLTLTAIAAASLAGVGALALSPGVSAQTTAASPGTSQATTPAPGVMPRGPMGGQAPAPFGAAGSAQPRIIVVGPPGGGPGGGPAARAWMAGGPWMQGHRGPWMHGQEMRRALFERMRTWGLFHRPANLALTPQDVKILGEAILLRNGQHSWTVGDVTPNADNTVSFAFVTAHGDVVARFAINTETGHIVRTN